MNAIGHLLKTACFAFWLQTAFKKYGNILKGQGFTNHRSNLSKDDLDFQSHTMAKAAIKMRHSSNREG